MNLLLLRQRRLKSANFTPWRVGFFVMVFHVLFLCFLSYEGSLRQPQIKPKERLVVSTVTLRKPLPAKIIPQEPKTSILKEPLSASPQILAPHPSEIVEQEILPQQLIPVKVEPLPVPKEVKKETPLKKQIIEKKTPTPIAAKPKKNSPATSKPVPKPTPVSEKTPQQEASQLKQRDLLAKARESLAKLDRNFQPPLSEKVQPIPPLKPIGSLKSDAVFLENHEEVFGPQERGYADELVSRLKLLLRLPEYGEVAVKLTLERSGKVAKLVIVSSESGTNRRYVEKTLPTLSFPAFGKNFSEEPVYTFSLFLKNE